jgi:hypothetical protein
MPRKSIAGGARCREWPNQRFGFMEEEEGKHSYTRSRSNRNQTDLPHVMHLATESSNGSLGGIDRDPEGELG